MNIKKIKIGYQDYKLLVDNDVLSGIGALGWTLKSRHKIYYSDDVPNHEQVDTIIHEVLHAIVQTYIHDVERANEEEVVSQIAHGLTQVLRDNPKLFPELKRML